MKNRKQQPRLHVVIVCKVIDNYGDAGFCLRLGRALAHQGHAVKIVHDNSQVFAWMHDPQECPSLTFIDATAQNPPAIKHQLDLILEPFGSSSEQTQHRFDQNLKQQWPNTPWLVIEYLSAESWVADFHLKSSINPITGHQSTFFFPGFRPNTGGLIHKDTPTPQTHHNNHKKNNLLKLFVFCYPNAPAQALKEACQYNALWLPPQQFVAQWRFDDLLQQHDVLFVRGEDSFVRGQLAGKPMVWQIYPCEDLSHIHKLKIFFELYTQNLNSCAKNALWNLWAFWNQINDTTHTNSTLNAKQVWNDFYNNLSTYQSHAVAWKNKLHQGKDLIHEVLNWHAKQKPQRSCL